MTSNQSTGPKSRAGKQISSQNAIKNGLSARRFLSEIELQEFQQTMEELVDEFDPQTKSELIQIERIATSTTRLRRIISIEDAKYAIAKKDQMKTSVTTRKLLNNIEGFAPESNAELSKIIQVEVDTALPNHQTLEMIHRMQTSISRQLSREIGELMVMIDRREKRYEAINSNESKIET